MKLEFYCNKCEKAYAIDTLKYKCTCGGLFKLKGQIGNIKTDLSLGEGETPLLQRKIGGENVYLKVDYMQPTGSFKDRGAVVLIDHLKKIGVSEIVEDSSGNAGASIAAYAAMANIDCCIYLPADTSEGKIKQIKSYGAEIIKVKGSRDDTSQAVQEAAQKRYYASHVYNPLFFAGTSSLAYELRENPENKLITHPGVYL
jgi:threonine synthase